MRGLFRGRLTVGGALLLVSSLAAAEPGDAIREAGGLVLPVAQSDPRLDVSLHLASGPIDDGLVAQLVPLNESQPIVWLNLAGCEITDAACESLAKLTQLERLHLERTNVTDAGLAKLTTLENLTYLNVYGTGVTDAGLETLGKLPSLKKAYVWQSKVTEPAIAVFREAHPEVELVGEIELPDPPQEEKNADTNADTKAEKKAGKKDEKKAEKKNDEKNDEKPGQKDGEKQPASKPDDEKPEAQGDVEKPKAEKPDAD